MIFVAIAAAILIVVVVIAIQRRSKLLKNGTIIRRDRDFFRQKEIFTLAPFEFSELIAKLKAMNWKEGANWNYSEQRKLILFDFAGLWKAQFCLIEETADKVVYEFTFTSWQEKNGTNTNALSMNATLTNVEKALVMTDPNTTVQSEYVKMKSR